MPVPLFQLEKTSFHFSTLLPAKEGLENGIFSQLRLIKSSFSDSEFKSLFWQISGALLEMT